MKKTLAVILASASAMSLGVSAFAQETVSNIPAANIPARNVTTKAPGLTETVKQPTGFVFGADAGNDNKTLGDILEPGTEYKFPVSMAFGEGSAEMAEDMLKEYKITYSKLSKEGVKTFEIKEYKGKYYLYVEAKDSVPNKAIDVKYNVKLIEKSGNKSVFAQEVKFSYGYDEAHGDYITGLGKGDTVEIDNDRPVITENQFDKIAKINDYKNVTLSGPSWTFTVNVTDESTKNMVNNNAGIKDILSKFPEQEFKFFQFAGKPVFNSTGRVALDIDDVSEDWSDLFAYRYANGKLYKLNATLNSDDNTMEFRTNTLDCFIVTDKAIKDGTVINTDVLDGNTDGNVEKPDNSDKNNPSTGASQNALVENAVMAAMAALSFGGVR